MGGKKKLKTPNLFLAAPPPTSPATDLAHHLRRRRRRTVLASVDWWGLGNRRTVNDLLLSFFLFLDFRFFFLGSGDEHQTSRFHDLVLDMIFVEVGDFNGRMMYYFASIHFKLSSFLIEIIWLIAGLINGSIFCGVPYLLNLDKDIDTPFFCCALA